MKQVNLLNLVQKKYDGSKFGSISAKLDVTIWLDRGVFLERATSEYLFMYWSCHH